MAVDDELSILGQEIAHVKSEVDRRYEAMLKANVATEEERTLCLNALETRAS